MWVPHWGVPRTYVHGTWYRHTGAGIPPYYVCNTIRVGVHIACIREGKGVGQFITRTRIYTIDCIYLYLVYVDIIRAPIWGPFFHLTPNLKKHKNGNLLFSKTLWRRGKYILKLFLFKPFNQYTCSSVISS